MKTLEEALARVTEAAEGREPNEWVAVVGSWHPNQFTEKRPPTVAELKELQERLTKAGFDTGGTNGRIGSDTMKAVRAYQKKVGIDPADGYAGLKVLTKLRAGT